MAYIAQTRRLTNDDWRYDQSPPWKVVGRPEQTAAEAARKLGDEMQRAGFHLSELHEHRADLVAGHILTADNSVQFRVVETEA